MTEHSTLHQAVTRPSSSPIEGPISSGPRVAIPLLTQDQPFISWNQLVSFPFSTGVGRTLAQKDPEVQTFQALLQAHLHQGPSCLP
jgi:hypothetical protein